MSNCPECAKANATIKELREALLPLANLMSKSTWVAKSVTTFATVIYDDGSYEIVNLTGNSIVAKQAMEKEPK